MLAAHPDVAEVAVTEVAVRDGVRVVTAFVVPAAGRAVDPAAVRSHARAHLAAYKCPREVVVVDHLPRTANGKVLRRSLRGS